jgi:hypothetical protein
MIERRLKLLIQKIIYVYFTHELFHILFLKAKKQRKKRRKADEEEEFEVK